MRQDGRSGSRTLLDKPHHRLKWNLPLCVISWREAPTLTAQRPLAILNEISHRGPGHEWARLTLVIAEEDARRSRHGWLGVVIGRQVGADFWQRRRVVGKVEREADHRAPYLSDLAYRLY